MEKYLKRVSDIILKDKLESKGAVLIEGPKWCGKTTTASMMAKSILYIQDPDKKRQNIEMSEIMPSRLLEGETPRLIDEWQLAPKLWDAVRYEVDKRDKFSQFILTGSSVPADLKNISHSGIGRICRMLMRPMSLYESLDSTGEVSLADLFENKNIDGKNKLSIDDIMYLICRGGWPKAVREKEKIALAQSIDYYDAITNYDISRVDNISRNPLNVQKLFRTITRAIGSQMTLTSMQRDMKAFEGDGITDETINSYIKALKKMFVVENSIAWNPNLRSKTAIRTSDTWYYVDPSIGTAALSLGPEDLMNDLNTAGLLFENMCIRDLRIYSEILSGEVYHYRDKNGLECDAVIHLKNGKYGFVEIKLGGDTAINEATSTLNLLEERIDIKKTNKPAFKMILTAVGEYAYKREDNIYIVPIGCLKY